MNIKLMTHKFVPFFFSFFFPPFLFFFGLITHNVFNFRIFSLENEEKEKKAKKNWILKLGSFFFNRKKSKGIQNLHVRWQNITL